MPTPPIRVGVPGEVLVDEVLVEPHGLEDLGAVVALGRADPHLGDDLDDPLRDCLAVLLLGELGGPGDHPEAHLVVDGFEGQVRVDRARAIADEEGEVMDLTRFARLQDQAHPGPSSGPDEVVVDGRDGQQSRDRGVDVVVAAVREDDDVVALGDRLRASVAELLDGLAQPGAAVRDSIDDRQGERLEPVRVAGGEASDLLELLVRQDGRGQLELVSRLGPGFQEVALRADRHLGGHDDLFTDGVDRRVGDLGEELLEVREEELRPL